jgi:predicted DCC family thiol-disulfide oxidoreductase YuxK
MKGTLFFDGECGVCTRARNVLDRWDKHSRIHTVPLQQPGTAERLGVEPGQLLSQVWWLSADGQRCGGAEAVNAALATVFDTRIPLVLYRVPGIRQLQDATYRWVATHRHRFRGTTLWCEEHPTDCAAPRRG